MMSDSFKLGTHLIIWFALILIFLMISCKGVKVSACIPEGQIIKQEGDRLLVIFEDIGDKPNTYWYQWFYMPGVGIVSSETHYLKVNLLPKKKP